ncbi:hypothetical protein M7I_7822 [Glarea lozoyensis 74030]|uniref:Uncharacterized protein n=1 Tax=Glarea lozoyensis (strain ATCC 74030 / MF5533) TaxID=1104152 RepID=H0EYC3_GLAL7|nr:hypothetical protein M7I_7822 [Glarea lozoyensis 74030]
MTAAHATNKARSADEMTRGSTKAELERLKQDSQIPAVLDGSGDSPCPFFQGPAKPQDNRARVLRTQKTFEYPKERIDLADRLVQTLASNQTYAGTGRPGGLSQARQNSKEKYDTTTFNNDVWYSSDDLSLHYSTDTVLADSNAVKDAAHVYAAKSPKVDSTRSPNPSLASQTYKRGGTRTGARDQVNAAYPVRGQHTEGNISPNNQAQAAYGKKPGRPDRIQDDWYAASTQAQRRPKDLKKAVSTWEMQSRPNAPSLAHALGMTWVGSDKLPKEPVREDHLSSLPVQNYAPPDTIVETRQSVLSISTGPGPDVGNRGRIPPSLSMNRFESMQPVVLDKTLRADQSLQPYMAPESAQYSVQHPGQYSAAGYNDSNYFHQVAESSNASSIRTMGTPKSVYRVDDPYPSGTATAPNRRGSNSSLSSKVLKMQDMAWIDMSSKARVLEKFSTIGTGCEKLCAMTAELLQANDAKSLRDKIMTKEAFKMTASAVHAEIGAINKVVKDCIEEMESNPQPFAQYEAQNAPQEAFRILSKNLQNVGMAIRDLGRDEKSVARMKSLISSMEKGAKSLRYDAEVMEK